MAMYQLENFFIVMLLEIGVRNCLACNTNFDNYHTCEAICGHRRIIIRIKNHLISIKYFA